MRLYRNIQNTLSYTKFSLSWEEQIYLTITQDDLINTIAQKEDIDVATVRRIFDATENTIFDYLSSVAPTQSVTIKLLNGLKIEGIYTPKRYVNQGIFPNTNGKAKIKPTAYFTKHYKRKLNSRNHTT